jgi:hypothetical protein
MKKKSKTNTRRSSKPDDDDLKEYLNEHYGPELMVADGLTDAFVCVAKVGQHYCAVYDNRKVLQILMKRDKMDRDEAWEFFCYNILGAYVGENTPIFINPDERKMIEITKIH